MKVRGSDTFAPHGVPLDLLDRTLVIPTTPYTADEMGRILQLRMDEEGIKVEAKAMQLLTKMSTSTSLRYVLQLLTAAHLIAKKRKSEVKKK